MIADPIVKWKATWKRWAEIKRSAARWDSAEAKEALECMPVKQRNDMVNASLRAAGGDERIEAQALQLSDQVPGLGELGAQEILAKIGQLLNTT